MCRLRSRPAGYPGILCTFSSVRQRCSNVDKIGHPRARPGPRRAHCRAPARRLAILRRGPEHVIPERRADAIAALVILEVVAHVQLAQSLAEPRLRTMVMHVVV